MEVPDESGYSTQAKVYCDGELVWDLAVRDWKVVSDGKFEGNSLHRGFNAWAGQIADVWR